MACRWHYDKKLNLRYHVPECWGTVHDPDGHCHCDDRVRDDEETSDRVGELEERVRELEKKLAAMPAKG